MKLTAASTIKQVAMFVPPESGFLLRINWIVYIQFAGMVRRKGRKRRSDRLFFSRHLKYTEKPDLSQLVSAHFLHICCTFAAHLPSRSPAPGRLSPTKGDRGRIVGWYNSFVAKISLYKQAESH